jgi:acetyltransferase-like isoleucine patch superfamily enzyme
MLLLRYLKRLITRVLHYYRRQVTHKVHGYNNKIENKGKLINVVFDIIGDNIHVIIGEGSVVKNAIIFIRGNHHRLVISKNCYFGEGELWMEDSHGSLLIHEYTTVERGHLAVTEPYSKLEIKKDCMLARHVEIRTGDSHSILDLETGERINKAANVTLEQHVWIGAHAKILKGVTIGENCIVGTSSVVTKDVPPNSLVVGIPAKIVRSNVVWKRERI